MTTRPESDYTVPRTQEEVSNTIQITKVYLVVYRLPSWRQLHSKRCNNIDKAYELENGFDADVKLNLLCTISTYNKQYPTNKIKTITTIMKRCKTPFRLK